VYEWQRLTEQGDVKDIGLADARQTQDRMGGTADAGAGVHSQAIREGAAAERLRFPRVCT